MLSRSAIRVAQVGGIPIRLHFTFLVILPLLAYAFGRSLAEAARRAGTPAAAPAGSPWLWGLAIAVALFASVLVHELAHALYATRHGGKVRSITLHMLGGVSELVAAPRSEALMAVAGPATSLALGGIALGAAALGRRAELPTFAFALTSLGELNLVLGVFNLLPAFPMDGGRILRGGLARRIGPVAATRIAARLGRAFALIFAAVGLLTLNVLLLLVALVVHTGADAEARDVLLRAELGDVRVLDVMSPLETGVAAEETLGAVAERMVQERRTAYPVTDGVRVLGVITSDALKRVPAEARGRATVRDAIRPSAVVEATERLVDAVHLLGRGGAAELAVVDRGRIVGTLSQLDVVRGLELRDLAGRGAGAASRPAS